MEGTGFLLSSCCALDISGVIGFFRGLLHHAASASAGVLVGGHVSIPSHRPLPFLLETGLVGKRFFLVSITPLLVTFGHSSVFANIDSSDNPQGSGLHSQEPYHLSSALRTLLQQRLITLSIRPKQVPHRQRLREISSFSSLQHPPSLLHHIFHDIVA